MLPHAPQQEGYGKKMTLFQMGLRRIMINSLISVVIAIAVFFSSNLSQSSFSSLYHPYYLFATLFLPDINCVEVWE
jgi:hypothetical protein